MLAQRDAEHKVQQAQYRKKTGEECANEILSEAKSALVKKQILINNAEA